MSRTFLVRSSGVMGFCRNSETEPEETEPEETEPEETEPEETEPEEAEPETPGCRAMSLV